MCLEWEELTGGFFLLVSGGSLLLKGRIWAQGEDGVRISYAVEGEGKFCSSCYKYERERGGWGKKNQGHDFSLYSLDLNRARLVLGSGVRAESKLFFCFVS